MSTITYTQESKDMLFKYRPNWVLVEQLNLTDIECLDFEIHQNMKSISYVLFAKTFNTLFYKEKSISV